jgi:AraC-like DNA-binding protein
VRYREIRPSVVLEPYIESYWTLHYEGGHDGGDAPSQRVVPDGHPELILNAKQPFEACVNGRWRGQPQSFLAGQIDGPLLLRPNGPADIVGVRFHPHGAAALLGVPMHELSGEFTPIGDLSAGLSGALHRALESPDPILALDSIFFRLAGCSRSHDQMVAEAVHRMVREQGASELAALARDFGISIRQFERRFNAAVGLPPKLFCRMQRFVQVFRSFDGEEPGNWVDTAVACGYYDQSHLIRDFKNFTGETPAVLLAEDTDLARHFLQRFGVSHSYNTAAGISL